MGEEERESRLDDGGSPLVWGQGSSAGHELSVMSEDSLRNPRSRCSGLPRPCTPPLRDSSIVPSDEAFSTTRSSILLIRTLHDRVTQRRSKATRPDPRPKIACSTAEEGSALAADDNPRDRQSMPLERRNTTLLVSLNVLRRSTNRETSTISPDETGANRTLDCVLESLLNVVPCPLPSEEPRQVLNDL